MRANEKKAQGDDKQKQIKFMDTAKLGTWVLVEGIKSV